jgi:ABC-type uncharacterized transport system involved in gliding motility auxiliary subunit
MMPQRKFAWIALALAALLFVGLNVFADNFFTDTRLDLTHAGTYTLSDGTRAIIAKLPEPVTLRFYFSRKNSANYPVTAAYAKRVRDLLGEYASLSHGKIILEDVDPEPFTPEEDEASAAGIRAAPTTGGNTLYFGIEGTSSIDEKEAIPYLAVEREAYLEYDLTSLLYQLSHPEKPKLAVLSALPLTNAPATPGQPMTIYAQLQRDYAVTMLNPAFTALPAGTNVLLIAHPGKLGQSQLDQIQSFVLHGGKALVFVDPISELARQEENPQALASSDLTPLLKQWGVDYSPQKVVLDRQLSQRIRTGDQGQSVAYPLWLHLTPENFAPRDPVTASLQSLNLASVGSLTPAKGATTHFEPLISSSNQASLADRDIVTATLGDPANLQQGMPTGIRYTIAARITGPQSVAGVGQGNINVIVVADSDVFDDRFWLRNDGLAAQPFADNEGLVLGAVENLSGSDDLISLRMRGDTERPFTVVRAMQADAELKYRETVTNLQGRLTASQQEIAQLQQGGSNSGIALTPAQTAEIERVRREIAGTRAVLRDVQRQLRADIDRLGTVLAFINILLMPLLVTGFAIWFGIRRRNRARGSRKNAGAGT